MIFSGYTSPKVLLHRVFFLASCNAMLVRALQDKLHNTIKTATYLAVLQEIKDNFSCTVNWQ